MLCDSDIENFAVQSELNIRHQSEKIGHEDIP